MYQPRLDMDDQQTSQPPSQPRLVVTQLGSGSRGNATVVVGPAGALLIDAGFSGKELARRAALMDVDLEQVRAIVITHQHVDHIRGASVLSRRLGVPLWGTGATVRSRRELRGDEDLHKLPRLGAVELAGLRVESMPVSHDARGTVILRIAGRLGIATDLGRAGASEREFLSGLDGLLLEFNHDTATLMAGDDPPWLKQRILSAKGHLSNDQAVELLTAPGFEPPRQVMWLGHLSERNNTAELALGAARNVMARRSAKIHCTSQAEPTTSFVLE